MNKDYIMFFIKKEIKKKFQIKCLEDETNMSHKIVDLISNYIKN